MTYLDFYNFVRPYHEFGLIYGTSMWWVHLWTSKESDSTFSGQNDLFEVLQAKLNHVDLIKNILPMWWNRKVQLTSKYSLGWPYMSILKLGHNNLSKDLLCEIRNRSCWLIWCPKDLLTGMDLKSTPGDRNSIPLPFSFERRQDWNFLSYVSHGGLENIKYRVRE